SLRPETSNVQRPRLRRGCGVASQLRSASRTGTNFQKDLSGESECVRVDPTENDGSRDQWPVVRRRANCRPSSLPPSATRSPEANQRISPPIAPHTNREVSGQSLFPAPCPTRANAVPAKSVWARCPALSIRPPSLEA